jgi:hypothetical protein
MREKGTYITESIIIKDNIKYIKKTTEIIGKNNVTLSYMNEYNPPLKFNSLNELPVC